MRWPWRQAADVNHITRLEIVFHTDPFSESSLQTLEDARMTLRRSAAAGQPLEMRERSRRQRDDSSLRPFADDL